MQSSEARDDTSGDLARIACYVGIDLLNDLTALERRADA